MSQIVNSPSPPSTPPATSKLAIASVAFGIIGFYTHIIALVGFVLGIIACHPTTNSHQKIKGRALAYVGTIISLFALAYSFIAPALTHARKKSEAVNCMHNIKILGDFMLQYSDSKGSLPESTNWCDAIFPSIRTKTFFRCPSDSKIAYGYSFNTKLSGKPIKEVNPQTVMLFESNGSWNRAGSRDDIATNRGHLNVTLADGSVFNISPSKLNSLRWNP